MAETDPIRDAKDRIIFTTLLRHELSEELGFAGTGGAGSRDRLAFLKKLNWNDPHVRDKSFEVYMRWIVNATKDSRQEDSEYANMRLSWGSPHTDGKDKLIRPQLRVMVAHVEEENEAYMLSFTPPRHEGGMTPGTRDVLEQIRRILREDLEVDVSPARVHPVVHPKTQHVQGAKLIGRNMYDKEGVTWDIMLPTAAVQQPLREIITGDREISRSHLPSWYN